MRGRCARVSKSPSGVNKRSARSGGEPSGADEQEARAREGPDGVDGAKRKIRLQQQECRNTAVFLSLKTES